MIYLDPTVRLYSKLNTPLMAEFRNQVTIIKLIVKVAITAAMGMVVTGTITADMGMIFTGTITADMGLIITVAITAAMSIIVIGAIQSAMLPQEETTRASQEQTWVI